ncbi:MAG: DUF523 and DUF1722 domain-containing protein [Myxococcota bacterium]|nr:DUF523 and DUF1722 domain-containing protein [Myxococcales bacterium]
MAEARLRIGVSSCLLGNGVRYDGGHKRDAFLVDQLGPFVEWVPVCPEVEAGLGTPRPSIQLVEEGGALRALETRSRRDRTRALERQARARVRDLRGLDLAGYVLKRDSPSCGMERVRVHREGQPVRRDGRGLFAAALLEAMPDLPVEEEGRLHDPRLRENFIERLFAYRRVRDLFAGPWRARDVVAFHTAHKIQVMAHSNESYRELGRLVARVRELPRAGFRDAYQAGFMGALRRLASRGRVANALHHMTGHLRGRVSSDDRRELAQLVDDYRAGLVPLVVPLTLLRHHARACEVDYLLGQVFLDPHPRELMLRNHV